MVTSPPRLFGEVMLIEVIEFKSFFTTNSGQEGDPAQLALFSNGTWGWDFLPNCKWWQYKKGAGRGIQDMSGPFLSLLYSRAEEVSVVC